MVNTRSQGLHSDNGSSVDELFPGPTKGPIPHEEELDEALSVRSDAFTDEERYEGDRPLPGQPPQDEIDAELAIVRADLLETRQRVRDGQARKQALLAQRAARTPRDATPNRALNPNLAAIQREQNRVHAAIELAKARADLEADRRTLALLNRVPTPGRAPRGPILHDTQVPLNLYGDTNAWTPRRRDSPDLPRFHGAKYKGNSFPECQQFIDDMENLFEMYPERLPPHLRVAFAIPYLASDARQDWTLYAERQRARSYDWTPREVEWSAFKTHLRDPYQGMQTQLEAEFEALRQADQEDVVAFRRRYLNIRAELLASGGDDRSATHFMYRLKPTLRNRVLLNPPTQNSFEAVYAHVRSCESIERGILLFDHVTTPQSANYGGSNGPSPVSYPSGGRNNQRSYPQVRQNPPAAAQPARVEAATNPPDGLKPEAKRPEVTCYNCGEIGHIRPNCDKPQKPPNGSAENVCNNCHLPGHIAKNCPTIRCYNCNGVGHMSSGCDQPRSARVATTTGSNNEPVGNRP